jgi:hypothetical protein
MSEVLQELNLLSQIELKVTNSEFFTGFVIGLIKAV